MEFAFTDEQEHLRREARRYLEDHFPSDGAWDKNSWQEIAKLGWTGISVPEARGGAGLTFLEEAVLFEEIGRALYRGPYFATIGLALPALSPERQGEVAAGERTYTAELADFPTPDRDLVDEVVVVNDAALAAAHSRSRARRARARGCRHRAAGARTRGRTREVTGAIRQADRHVSGGFPQARRHLPRNRARPLARVLGRVVRRRRRRGRPGRFRCGEELCGRCCRRGVRTIDPSPWRDGLHLGEPAAPLLQAGVVDPGVRRLRPVPPSADRKRAPRLATQGADPTGRRHRSIAEEIEGSIRSMARESSGRRCGPPFARRTGCGASRMQLRRRFTT